MLKESVFELSAEKMVFKIQVHLQTDSQKKKPTSLVKLAVRVVKADGLTGLYNGLSASVVRSLAYSTTRFAIYDIVKNSDYVNDPLPFYQKIALGAFAGICGGFCGSPGDMVNVRMQNDMKLAPELRRKFDLLQLAPKSCAKSPAFTYPVYVEYFSATDTCFMVAFYDQSNQILLGTGHFEDNLVLHLCASAMASTVCTVITQPFDVMKTKLMNAKPGEFKNMTDCFKHTLKIGPLAFYKGFVPQFLRLAPQTILTFVFLEHNFGYLPIQQQTAGAVRTEEDLEIADPTAELTENTIGHFTHHPTH